MQAQQDKLLEAKASYSAWLESKKDFGKDKLIAKKKEEKKKKKEEHEKAERKADAEHVSGGRIPVWNPCF